MAICNFSQVYKPLFYQKARYYDLIGGRMRGGSYSGTLYFLHLITQPKYFRGCLLRQVLGDVRTSLFQDFKDRIDEVEQANGSVRREDFDINESIMTIIYRPTGNMILSKGVTKTSGRTAKLKSLAGVTHVLIEEADELGQEDFDQLDISLRTIKVEGGVQVIRVFNPPHKAHWLWTDYNLVEATQSYFDKFKLPKPKDDYYIMSPKAGKGVVMIFSTYHDNLKNLDRTSVEKLENYRLTNPDYYYTIVLGLVSEGQKGRIFKGWKPITNAFYNGIDAKSIFGLDFGLARPAGIVEAKMIKNNLYLREQNYEPLTNKEIGKKLCELGAKKWNIVADSAEPDSISRLRRGWEKAGDKDVLTDMPELMEDAFQNGKPIKQLKEIYKPMYDGFNIYPATKGPGSVKAGISHLKELNVFVTEDSANLWMEYREYKWALDKNKNPTDEPIDMYNHLIDPTRYIVKDSAKLY